jgi:hypothetical protein
MKYNVLGFYQPKAIELGLESNDLLVLRWFVDYAGTGKMRTMLIDNKIYYWINYNSILEELPILKITKQTLARKHFGNLVRANVLEHKHITEGGSFSYYCYGINYETLIYLQSEEGGCVKNNDPMSKNTEGCVNSDIGGMSKNTQQMNNLQYNNNSIIYPKENIIINNNTKEKQKHKHGEYNNVLLSDDELGKLNETYGADTTQRAITYLDEYIEMKGYKAKSHYLCIRKWVISALKERKGSMSLQDKLAIAFKELDEERGEL